MKLGSKILAGALAAAVVMPLIPTSPAATSKEARVTQVIREVNLLPANADPRAAALNDKVSEDTGVRTGGDSRSELTFPDLTITRLGANTIFSFSTSGRTATVDSGSILLRVPKDSGGGSIRSSAVTVAITGTTVIFERNPEGQSRLITLEGTARVALNTKPKEWRKVRAGQMLEVPDGATTLPMPVNIDLDELMRTHPLIVDFKPLPSEPLIRQVVRRAPPPTSAGPVTPVIAPNGTGFCWICVDGKVVQVSEEDARRGGQQCYPTKEAALRECKERWWCCINGQVVRATEEECRAEGGKLFRTETEARRECSSSNRRCWVCVDGSLVQLTEAEARARKLPCYGSREEAAGYCRDKKPCWTCIKGQVLQLTEREARTKGAQCYGSKEEAVRNCTPKDKTWWICRDGQVTQVSESAAAGAKRYSSREEALKACKPKETTCWTCIDGQVVQLTEAQARAKERQCYGSRREAALACNPQKPSPTPTAGPILRKQPIPTTKPGATQTPTQSKKKQQPSSSGPR